MEQNTEDMTVVVIILITAPLLIFILATPVILCVDTETNDYCFRLGDLLSLRAIPEIENPRVRLRIGFWKKRWEIGQHIFRKRSRGPNNAMSKAEEVNKDNIESKTKTVEGDTADRKGKVVSGENAGIKNKTLSKWAGLLGIRGIKRPGDSKNFSTGSLLRVWRVIRTFKMSKCDVVLDTDDYIMNAQLFPLFQFCNGRWGHWRVSFEGDFRIRLEVESRVIRVLYAWWKKA